jgi:hypothetical protein
MKKETPRLLLLSGLLLLFGGILLRKALSLRPRPAPATAKFDGERAYADLLRQTDLGARTPNSFAHAQTRAWIQAELTAAGWQVEEQSFEKMGHHGYNIIASRNTDPPEIILGAHYDSRLRADNDPEPEKRNQALVGANDGASGVAILLELARTIPAAQQADSSVWLVFFDLEDNGRLPGWDWILGSRAFVEEHTEINPAAVLILDMVGDADLNIYFEQNSDPTLRAEIWQSAAELGYAQNFIAEEKFSLLDDHTPFLEAGFPAVDIIDFDYPYWHTAADTADKVSPESLQKVGETVQNWLWQQ